jgi:AcrR family transcriptional regulator
MDELIIIQDQRPTRIDAVKNRELLICTARRLFAEHGVENITMSAIADAASVGKGTLYRHFPSKADICHALLDGLQRQLQEQTFARLREFPDEPLANLHWFVNAVLDFVEANLDLLSLGSLLNINPIMQHHAHDWWRLTLRGLLLKLNLTLDVDFMADSLYVLIDPRTIYYMKTVRGFETSRIRAGLSEMVSHLAL